MYVSEEPDMMNATLDNERSLNKIWLCISLFLCFKPLEKVKNMLNWYNTTEINICFKLIPISRMVNLTCVELSGELMQEIHKIWYWNKLETNRYLVLIALKGIFTFFC